MTKSAAILGVVNSLLALLLAAGLNIDNELQVAIVGFVNALLILGVAFFDPKVPFGRKP